MPKTNLLALKQVQLFLLCIRPILILHWSKVFIMEVMTMAQEIGLNTLMKLMQTTCMLYLLQCTMMGIHHSFFPLVMVMMPKWHMDSSPLSVVLYPP
nr:hypothetical protein Iba_chr14aCG22710 [Ipomoea batatas]GMD91020.1 hypothetical protein Iba_chr14dCG15340 [Ipomoea batatas]